MRLLILLTVGAAMLGAPTPLLAQRPLTVTGVRGLTFGVVFPGVALVMPRTDPGGSGQFDIRGPNRAQIQLTFTLPAAMTGPGGAQMPLLFGSSDAGYAESQTIGSQVGFDPKQPFTAALSVSGRGSVFVGATANPAANQRAGTYTATLTLTVTILP